MPQSSPKRVAVLLYSSYPADPRPRRAAEALISAGMEVDVLCLQNGEIAHKTEVVGGVNVYRVSLAHTRGGAFTYLLQYARFFLAATGFVTRRGIFRRYDIVHVHNMPDFLVFAALVPRLLGAKIVLDLHDPMPELMENIFRVPRTDFRVRILRGIERLSIGFAHQVLTPNIAFKRLFESRSSKRSKIEIVMNTPEEQIFHSEEEAGVLCQSRTNQFRLMHHGSILERHGLDQLVKAVASLRTRIPHITLDIYGAETPFLHEVMALVDKLDLKACVRYHGGKPQAIIAKAIASCDLGVIPNRRSGFTELNFPTRLFEYLAMNRPVLAPSTLGIRDYFNENSLLFFDPDTDGSLESAILRAYSDPELCSSLVKNGSSVYKQWLWSKEKAKLISIMQRLMVSP